MKIVKPDNLSLLYAPVMLGQNLVLSIAALGCFTFDQAVDDRLLEAPRMWAVIAENLGKGEVLDIGLPKVRGEYLVYGSCFAPQPVPALTVGVEVGASSKVLMVSGNRRAQKMTGIPHPPEPFTEMELTYERSYGGPGCARNPVGRGFATDDKGRLLMPNIQDPKHIEIAPGRRLGRPGRICLLSPRMAPKDGEPGRLRQELACRTMASPSFRYQPGIFQHRTG